MTFKDRGRNLQRLKSRTINPAPMMSLWNDRVILHSLVRLVSAWLIGDFIGSMQKWLFWMIYVYNEKFGKISQTSRKYPEREKSREIANKVVESLFVVGIWSKYEGAFVRSSSELRLCSNCDQRVLNMVARDVRIFVDFSFNRLYMMAKEHD